MQIDIAVTPDGTRIETKTDTANQFDWMKEVTAVHPDFIDKITINDNGAPASAQYFGASLTGEIGLALGSSLGRLLGGNSLVGQVAASTVIGTIGKEIGQALTYGGAYTLDVAVKDAFGTLGGGTGVGALPSAAIGAVSSLLIGELAKSLHLTGFEGGLVTTIGTSITTQLITNAYGVATGATLPGPNGPVPYTMTTGFDPTALAGNLGGAIGGYLGSTLAAHVMVPHYQEGAIGESVGSSVGGAIGAFLLIEIPVVGPIVGSFVGSFLGGVAGALLGDLAGNDPESHGTLTLGADHHFWPDPASFYGDHGATGYTFRDIATYTALTMNAIGDFAGVTMSAPPLPPGVEGRGGNVDLGLQLRYTQDDHDWFINENGKPAFIWLQNVQHDVDLAPLTDAGIMYLAHNAVITGGDPLVRYAWSHSTANNPSAFAVDLQIAKDYREYLDDKDMIDLMIAAAPESAFATGWALTLLKAHELGLDAQGANNDFRAGNDTINGTSAHELLIGGAGNDVIYGDGGNDRIRGDVGNDTLRGGVGDDVIIGGDGVDTAVFAGLRSAYTLTDLGGGLIGVAGPDGSDTLIQMERLQFDDQVVTLPLLRDLAPTFSLLGPTAAYLGIRNNGNIQAAASTAGIYLSADTTVTTADTLIASSATTALNGGATDSRALSLYYPTNLTPGTYYLGAIADKDGQVSESDELNNISTVIAIILGNNAANALTGTAAADTLIGLGGDDILNGGGASDLLAGGTGADAFVFDATALANAQSGVFDRITDYDLSGMAFNAAEGDTIDLSAILQSAINSGQSIASLVRVFQSGTGATLQVDTDGTANGANWVTIARLEGLHAGNTVAIHPSAAPGSQAITVQWPNTTDFGGDHNSDIFWRTNSGALALWTMTGQVIGGGYLQWNGAQVNTPGPDWHIMSTGDFDGDGKADVFWSTDAGWLAVWEMDSITVKWADYVRNGSALVGKPGADWHVAGTRDFDGDFKADLLWRTNSGALAIWEMDGTQLKAADYIKMGSTQINAPGPNWHIASTDDFDGDGKGDILWNIDGGWLAVWQMNGTQIKSADYVLWGGSPLAMPANWHMVGAADFDGDGKGGDLLWRIDGGPLAIWLMDGNVIRGSSDYIRIGGTQINTPGPDWHIERFGDYDGDGKSDILWQTDSGAVAIWEMNGTQIKFADYATWMGGPIMSMPADWHIVKPQYDLM